ncbi:TraX family protein [Gottschalkia acidurici 9a]|uniref:TraX family protein n=1 Tax=Gottschalkia acidurici (strain ATCC 7906 / DSM 604 / BCRC 14475 / CIP 104303 / KCTC 5404 / NCIMB 10678 / 9a) TaxID=1128398 RepID=K0AXT8_GOTA9|nr:TraX family protein [Gottschalkia acidurici]AFS77597.1 TraX family protein [Gottschalkia acidurici 9a]
MKEKGLTGFQLKIIGLILMIFDHIYSLFGAIGNIPVVFKWAGRIVAPIFIFMTVEGYVHTRNKKKYMLRLYLASVLMSIGNDLVYKYFSRADGAILSNNIFATLFLITLYLCIIDFIKNAMNKKSTLKIALGVVLLILPIALSVAFIILMSNMSNISILSYLMRLIPLPILVEGGPLFILIGIFMYLLRENRKNVFIVYTIMSLALMFTGELSIKTILFNNYQWMMVFAAPLMHLYNGQKGRGMKYLFYIFYPAHIYIFYIASSLMMKR